MKEVSSGDFDPISTPPAICDALRAELDAAVAQTAPVAWQTAGTSCFRDPITGQSCSAYHRSWQYLLMLGIHNSTHPDTQFLLDSFRAHARRGDRRILVSGSADYAMLAHILRAYELEHSEPRVTVIDRCETPLSLNRWYAGCAGVSVETVQSDAISYAATQPYDIVCTHSFIGWFSPENRERLVAAWAGNLRPGGHVITTRRLRQSNRGEGRHGYDDQELLQFEGKVRAAAVAQRHRLSLDPEEIVSAAMEDARTRIRYTMTSSEELAALFERNGLAVVVADDSASTVPDDNHIPSGPVRGAGKRVRIIARLGEKA